MWWDGGQRRAGPESSPALFVLEFAVSYWIFRVLHELVHVLVAALVGFGAEVVNVRNLKTIIMGTCVEVDRISGWKASAVRHAGWFGSCGLAMGTILFALPDTVMAAAIWTALDAACSDLFMIDATHLTQIFRCGNFGILMLGEDNKKMAMELLRTMIRVSMIRGSHAGGVVTYVPRKKGMYGIRSRVVNGKRTDLSKLVIAKISRDEWYASKSMSKGLPKFYGAHTRFAKSATASIENAQPHKWSPRSEFKVWKEQEEGWQSEIVNVEVYVGHVGELDYWTVSGIAYPVDSLLPWIQNATYSPCPSPFDSSACIAGIMDLIRTQGSWYHSIRYGFLFGKDRETLSYEMPTKKEFLEAAEVAEWEFLDSTKPHKSVHELRRIVVQRLRNRFESTRVLGFVTPPTIARFVECAVTAFFEQDLLQAMRTFLSKAKGSFALFSSCSIDAHRQFVLASRGQALSLGIYPRSGIVLWGTEQAAVKAALDGNDVLIERIEQFAGQEINIKSAFRLDLDDLSGEICLVDFGKGLPSVVPSAENLKRVPLMQGRVSITLVQEMPVLQCNAGFHKRLVPMEGNPMVIPLRSFVKDNVGADIAGIPVHPNPLRIFQFRFDPYWMYWKHFLRFTFVSQAALQNIQDEWHEGTSINNVTMFWFGRFLCDRITAYRNGSHDGSVDLLLTGCEVSLWLMEQFASDLSQVFPRLSIKVVSANKLLGLFGREVPIPQSGHQIHERSWNLEGSVVLIASHSGSTYSSLAVSNLMQVFTKKIFVITSEFDTQLGRQLRKMSSLAGGWDLKSYIFVTNVGLRTAEPCTISVAATHQIMTQILLDLMRQVQLKELENASGNGFVADDYFQLEELNRRNIEAIEEIVGFTKKGVNCPTTTSKELRKRGSFWATHILEVPISWIMAMLYIIITVTAGRTLIAGIAVTGGMEAWVNDKGSQPSQKLQACLFFDAIIILFAPQWCCILLRIIQRRNLRHRMKGRTVIIGDIPWVAQCVESYLSKLFSCAYSAASISVHSGNPSDHLVHRIMHRIVRGSLFACGRPDGRLSALTEAEESTCITVNVASSIQSIGSTCESLTIGHNPSKLKLSEWAIFLKGSRKKYLCEHLLERQSGYNLQGRSSSELIVDYARLHKQPHNPSDIFSLDEQKQTVKKISARHSKLMTGKLGESQMSTSFQEKYYGENLEKASKGIPSATLVGEQSLSIRLYETRIASLQRAIAFYVMFHQMAKDVQNFWPMVSFGLLKYDMSRTHSVLRIASTPHPVGATEVQDRTLQLALCRKMKTVKKRIVGLVLTRRVRKGAKMGLFGQNTPTSTPLKYRQTETPIQQLAALLNTPIETASQEFREAKSLLEQPVRSAALSRGNGFVVVSDRQEFYPTPHGALPPSIMQPGSVLQQEMVLPLPFSTWSTRPPRSRNNVSAELVFTGPEPSGHGKVAATTIVASSSLGIITPRGVGAASLAPSPANVPGAPRSSPNIMPVSTPTGSLPATSGLQMGVIGFSQPSSRHWDDSPENSGSVINWA